MLQVFGIDVLLDSKLNPTLLEINTNPGFVGRAGETDHRGRFEGLFSRLNRIMCDFMWTSVVKQLPPDVMVLLDNTSGPQSAAETPLRGLPDPRGRQERRGLQVALEPLNMTHFEDLVHVVRDPTVMRTVRKGRTLSVEDLVKQCTRSETDWRNTSKQYHHWAIVVQTDPGSIDGVRAAAGAVTTDVPLKYAVGLLLWHRHSEQDPLSLRILVSSHAQRRGVASRALRLSIDELRRLYLASSVVAGAMTLAADVHHGNAASAGLLRKCGFRFVGTGHYGRIGVDKFELRLPPEAAAAD